MNNLTNKQTNKKANACKKNTLNDCKRMHS